MDVVVWGINSTCPSMTEYLIRKYGEKVLFIVNRNPASWGKSVFGKEVFDPERLKEYHPGEIKIIIATYKHIDEIMEQAQGYGHRAVSLVRDMDEEYFDYLSQGFVQNEIGYLPQELHINFTEECNLRCAWCYFHGLAGRPVNRPASEIMHISDDTLSHIINGVRDISSLDTLCYATAGELFMNPRWFEQVGMVIREIPQIQKFILTSNGMMLNETNIDKLMRLNVRQITVNFSIDGLSSQDTEKYRVNSSYEKIRQNIRLLQKKIDGDNRFALTLQNYHPLHKGERPAEPFPPQYLLEDFPEIPCDTGIVLTPDLNNDDFSQYDLVSTALPNEQERGICFPPFRSMYFDYLGNMRMCACGQFSKQIVIGKANSHCLETWQTNPIMEEIRSQFKEFKPCRYCGHCFIQNLKQIHYLCEK